jgi:hypothetical protein
MDGGIGYSRWTAVSAYHHPFVNAGFVKRMPALHYAHFAFNLVLVLRQADLEVDSALRVSEEARVPSTSMGTYKTLLYANSEDGTRCAFILDLAALDNSQT